MKKHVSHKDLIKIFIEGADVKRSVIIKKHLAKCRACALKYKKLQNICAPYYQQKISIPEAVKERVLNSFHKINDNLYKKPVEIKFYQRPYFKPVLGFALALIIFSLGIGLYLFNQNNKTEQVFFTVKNKEGNVLLNNQNLKAGLKISEKSRLLLTGQAKIELALANRIQIFLAGKGEFYIEKACLDINAKKYHFVFNFPEGQLFSNVDNSRRDIIYSYKTPQAVISPLGTQFILKSDENKTELYLQEGRVYLTMNSTKERMLAKASSKVVITRHEIEEKIFSKNDKDFFNVFIGRDNEKNNYTSKKEKKQKIIFQENEQKDLPLQEQLNRKKLQQERKNIKKELGKTKTRSRRKSR